MLGTASLNELEPSEYCRRKGLYLQQVQAWRETCRQAHAPPFSKAEPEKMRQQVKAINALEAQLRRRDKALVTSAALLVLQKLRALWEKSGAE